MLRRALPLALAALAALPALAVAQSPFCVERTSADGLAMKPGPPLRMGIAPAGEAGALGPSVPVTPIDRDKTIAALDQLRPAGAPFVLRLNRLFWADGDAGIARFKALTDLYTSHGFPVEIQVRYHPDAAHDGDVDGFLGFVRQVVDTFGPNPWVVGLQVTNEVNFSISPDSSDGAFKSAKDALIRGVIAAKDEAVKKGFGQLTIGFNWFYRTDPASETQFWTYLGDHGGKAFLAALDWVGLDIYPGTVFPPTEPPGGHRDAIVAGLSALRDCFLPLAHVPASVPIHIEENGWPTGPGRTEDNQVANMKLMVDAVNDFRGTYNVTDYRWFDLRDHNTSSTNFQHHYGLLNDDYTPKPAFATYRQLVAQDTLRPGPARLTIHATRVGRRCAIAASMTGPDAGAVRRADITAVAGHRLRATLALADGRVVSLGRASPRLCRGRRLRFA
ncbi:MAG TPA: hypothetical protein VIL64_00360 [Solirubrobacteraceae bacterium]|jgi:hypothetical protein